MSDFISAPGWERPLDLLHRRHEVLAVRLIDPREIGAPDVGPIIMEDAETGEQLYVDTGDKGFRRRFAEAARSREEAVNAAFRRAGVEAVSLSTDEDLVRAIIRMATLRRAAAGLTVSFIWPTMLVAVVLVPLGVLLYLRPRRTAPAGAASAAGSASARATVRRPLGVRARIPAAPVRRAGSRS